MTRNANGLTKFYRAWSRNRDGLLHGHHLFLLSHMRSYSSVFSHILGSHPEICGHAERQRAYGGRWALFKLRTALGAGDAWLPSQRYYLDKLLHNRLTLGPGVLGSNRVRLIVFVRRPEDTLRSLMALARRDGRIRQYADPVFAADHYESRLRSIVETMEQSECPRIFLTAERLSDELDSVLAELSVWLELRTPLSGRYKVFAETGKPRAGDTSEHIHAGRFVGGRDPHHEVAIDRSVLVRCEQAYAWFIDAMRGSAMPTRLTLTAEASVR